MSLWHHRVGKSIALCSLCVWVIAGCGPANNGLPDTVVVELPDGTEVQTTMGAGVISFADSRWEFIQSGPASQGIPFVTIRFGADGELAAFENNTIASEIFGTELLFDGQRHSTSQAGLDYAATTFGAETTDSQGFTFEGRLTAFAAGFEAANGTAIAMGTFDGEDINTVRGTFSFTSRVTLLDIPEGNIDMEFSFVGHRVIE